MTEEDKQQEFLKFLYERDFKELHEIYSMGPVYIAVMTGDKYGIFIKPRGLWTIIFQLESARFTDVYDKIYELLKKEFEEYKAAVEK